MSDLTLSAPAGGAEVTAATASAAEILRDLARRHGVAYEPAPVDAFAADVSRLSEAEVPRDEIADLVVALKRAGVLDSHKATSLYGDHLVQMRG